MSTIEEQQAQLRDAIKRILIKNATAPKENHISWGYTHEKLQELFEQEYSLREARLIEKLGSRNVAVCSKCSSLFKAKHENCKALSELKGGKV